jgi:methylmalonyl-CoA mutase C-terminal domain/subunit
LDRSLKGFAARFDNSAAICYISLTPHCGTALFFGSVRKYCPNYMKAERKIRVLVAKPGLDGHDRGVKVVAAALRDAGMEVIYSGLHQTPEMIVETAIQEDVDVVGLSVLSGAHMTLFKKVRDLLHERGANHIILTGGGIIPEEDREALLKMGVAALFGPGATTTEIIDFIRRACA